MWCQVFVSLLWFWIVIPPQLVAYEEDAQINPKEITKHNRYASRNTEPHTHTCTHHEKDKHDASERSWHFRQWVQWQLVEELGKEFKWQLLKITFKREGKRWAGEEKESRQRWTQRHGRESQHGNSRKDSEQKRSRGKRPLMDVIRRRNTSGGRQNRAPHADIS